MLEDGIHSPGFERGRTYSRSMSRWSGPKYGARGPASVVGVFSTGTLGEPCAGCRSVCWRSGATTSAAVDRPGLWQQILSSKERPPRAYFFWGAVTAERAFLQPS
jgi:hypothetical protein